MRKKLLIIIALCVLVSSAVFAGSGIKLYINGNLQYTDIITKNGTTYVPLRLVAEEFDKAVKWDGKNREIHINDRIKRPEVKAEELKEITEKALDQLLYYDFPHYVMVCENVKRIYLLDKIQSEGFNGAATITGGNL